MKKGLKLALVMVMAGLFLTACGRHNEVKTTEETSPPPEDKQIVEVEDTKEPATVYMTKTIDSNGLMEIYKALNHPLEADKVAVKISTGEDGSNFLDPALIKELVQSVKGTIVECNTAYGGERAGTEMHYQLAKDHGYTDIAEVDIMDKDGSMSIPIPEGTYNKEDLVGANLKNYDGMIVLSHFKGHVMAGYGGALKNLSIGVASKEGKCLIHTAGKSNATMRGGDTAKFQESMAEAASAVSNYFGDKIVYINVMNKLSVDCDCDTSPEKPSMEDIGILASTDPVALDQACIDLVYKASDGADLITRIESLNGIHILDHAEAIGYGNRKYKLKSIDK